MSKRTTTSKGLRAKTRKLNRTNESLAADLKATRVALGKAQDALVEANARERPAFMAGLSIDAGHQDAEQEWQQYRCKDDKNWKVADDNKGDTDELNNRDTSDIEETVPSPE